MILPSYKLKISLMQNVHPIEITLLFTFVFNLMYFLIDYFFWIIGIRLYKLLMIFGVFMLLFLFSKKFRLDKKTLILIPILIIIAFFALIYNNSGIGCIVQFLWPVILIVSFGSYTPSKDFLKILSLISRFFIILFTLKATIYYKGIDLGDFLDNGGREVNPNSTALILAFLFWFSSLDNKESKKTDIIWLLIVCFGITNCSSRSSLVALLFTFFLYYFFSDKMCKKRLGTLFVSFSIMVIGVLFPIFYVKVFKSGVLRDGEILGKNVFSGREWIWMRFFDYLKNNTSAFLFGTGYNDSFYKSGSFNLHNAYLMIFAQYGIIVSLTYLIYLISIFANMYHKGAVGDLKLRMYFVVIINLFVGATETTLSYIPLLIFPAIALALCKNRKVDELYVYSKSDSLLLVR